MSALSSLLELLVVFLDDFFADLLDFADFFDLLEALERADALAMNTLHVKGSSII